MAKSQDIYKLMWEAGRLYELFALSLERQYKQDAFDVLAWASEHGVVADLAPPHARFAPLSYSFEGVVGFHSAVEFALHTGDAKLIEELADAAVPAINFGGRNLSQQISPQVTEAFFSVPVEMLPSDAAFSSFLKRYVFDAPESIDVGNMRAAFGKWMQIPSSSSAVWLMYPGSNGPMLTRSYGYNLTRGRLDLAHKNASISTTYSEFSSLPKDASGRTEPAQDGVNIVGFKDLSSFDLLLAQGMMESAKCIVLQGGISPSPKNLAVMLAFGRHEEVFELLEAYLQRRPDCVVDAHSSLLEAICSPLVEELTSSKMNEERLHALRVRLLDMALAWGVDINARVHVRRHGLDWVSPLHMVRDSRMVQALLERGANVDALNSKGDTPLLRLLRDWREERQRSELDCLSLLLQAGASVSVRDERSRTVYQVAAPRGDEVKTLLRSAKLQQSVVESAFGVGSTEQDVVPEVAPRRRGFSL